MCLINNITYLAPTPLSPMLCQISLKQMIQQLKLCSSVCSSVVCDPFSNTQCHILFCNLPQLLTSFLHLRVFSASIIQCCSSQSLVYAQNSPASSCSFHIQQRKLKTKERRKRRQTRRSLTKLHGGEVIIHQHPHLLKSSQLPAPFQNQGDGCARQIPPTLLSGWLPPTARGATHHQPLPGQHIISDLHWRRWTGMRRGWPHGR